MFTSIFVQLLQDKGITPYRIAKETGISQGLMNEYKSGKKSPNIQNLIKIADYLDCSTDYLLGRTDNPDSHKNKLK
ncbi:helix-turn-helix transcriptional regulator [Porcipelethomonas sp.]|uniref:helix-turn-helix domain-containing protein n=1 Tax=Porcipelethomonas sp. TaxID=2981675 RepID=UPI003077B9D5